MTVLARFGRRPGARGFGDRTDAERIADCAQESGGANADGSARIRSMRTRGADWGRGWAKWVICSLRVFGILLALCGAGICLSAQEPGPAAARTTIVIYSDGPMADSAWALLFAELRKEAETEGRDIPDLEAAPQLLRGIDVVPGQWTENPIGVKLLGDVQPPVGLGLFPAGARV